MWMANNEYHIPVLLKASVDALVIDPAGVYVDVTYGGGGHSKELLSRLTSGRLFAFDQDKDAVKNVVEDERMVFVPYNFSYMRNHLRLNGVQYVDGVLADLGVSSHQFDTPQRGFSFRFDAMLDMRMDQHSNVSARDVVMEYSQDELLRVFREYGELKNAYSVASRIVYKRNEVAIDTVFKLRDILENLAPRGKENTFFAKVFQALRIEVNDEMFVLRNFLEQTPEVLKKGGRLVVITYHSLEDRLVKNFIKSGSFSGVVEKDFYGNVVRPFKEVNRKPIIPGEDEVVLNNRARSAKLRIAERL